MRFNRGKRYTYYSSYSHSSRSRIRWDRIAIIGVVVALVIGVAVWFNFDRIQLAIKGYSFDQQNQILALDGDEVDEILSHDKLSHISQWIEQSEKVQYYDEYEQYLSLHKDLEVENVISTIDEIFDNYVPKLTTLNYSNDQIWEVLKTAGVNEVKHLVDQQYTYAQIEPFMKVKGFVFADLDKYMEVYAENQNYNYAVLITTYPFIISENQPETSYTIQNPDDVLTLVKKGFYLSSDYEPSDLVTPDPDKVKVASDCDDSRLRKEAADALVDMFEAAKQEGYDLVINSAYRSYANQKKTYDEYFDTYDEVTAASLVAEPGASEHQTGLGVDLTCQAVIDDHLNGITNSRFGYKPDYKWCVANSYKYGFILRYEEDKADITGIANEPWHFRYVGKEAAKEIFNNSWTLEEYCLNKGVIPDIQEK